MTVKEVSSVLEELAPLGHAEDFDNVGLLVGNPTQEVNGILVTLDTLENVVDEAIAKNCNLIVSFHPIVFSGLKKITGKTYVERVVMKALAHSIAIYSMHTALDNSPAGVNAKICEVLGLVNPRILIPKKKALKKLVTYIPKTHEQEVKEALFATGAGALGNYSHCSFKTEGQGSFMAKEGANPTLGTVGTLHIEEEIQLNLTFDAILEAKVLQALFHSHPYEEVAYEITSLDNSHQNLGMGMVGELPKAISETEFLDLLKDKMNAAVVRHSALLDKPIQKVAVLGGSGAFAIGAAKACGADIYVTADLKYHQFYEAEGQLVLADIGHFETEQFTKNLLVEFLNKKIPNFAVTLSESITNPIKYY